MLLIIDIPFNIDEARGVLKDDIEWILNEVFYYAVDRVYHGDDGDKPEFIILDSFIKKPLNSDQLSRVETMFSQIFDTLIELTYRLIDLGLGIDYLYNEEPIDILVAGSVIYCYDKYARSMYGKRKAV